MLKTLSVSELSSYITGIFEAEELLQNIKVFGEVSGLSALVRGNLYFSLKDENSLISCIMFGASSANIKEGDQVVVTGSLRYYSKGGKLNLYVNSIVPYGSGVLYQRFLELKEKLQAEGVFDSVHKKPLPKKINTIGVITSKTGAVVHDIETVSHRRNPGLDIVVFPAAVQGIGAENTIINGLKYFDKCDDIDVVIIARGGGSIEDLQPFNTESLARTIISISKPVVSAVGHETDFTICDFASSIRAATPSVAAELVSTNIFDGFDKIKSNISKLNYLILTLIDNKQEKQDNLTEKLKLQIKLKVDEQKEKFLKNIQLLSTLSNNFLIERQHNIELATANLTHLNPNDALDRGWVKVRGSLRDNIISAKQIRKGDFLTIELKDGIADATIQKVALREN